MMYSNKYNVTIAVFFDSLMHCSKEKLLAQIKSYNTSNSHVTIVINAFFFYNLYLKLPQNATVK